MALSVLVLAACGGVEEVEPDGKLERVEAMYEDYRSQFPEVEEVTVEELLAELESDTPPLLLDVRTEEEREVSTIPGAISLEELEARRDELAGRRVVTYCTIGYRSGQVAERLSEEGWDARNLRGSILAWTHAGRPLDHEGSPTFRLHVYGARWDLAAEGYETVW